MSFTYDPENITNNGVDRVRFSLADTDPDDVLLQDAEITALVDDAGSEDGAWRLAVARGARIIEAGFRRLVDLSVGPIKLDFQRRAESYSQIANQYEELTGIGPGDPNGTGAGAANPAFGQGISAGGISPGSNYFTSGMMANPGSGTNPDRFGGYSDSFDYADRDGG